jgi:hypothetical protein
MEWGQWEADLLRNLYSRELRLWRVQYLVALKDGLQEVPKGDK